VGEPVIGIQNDFVLGSCVQRGLSAVVKINCSGVQVEFVLAATWVC